MNEMDNGAFVDDEINSTARNENKDKEKSEPATSQRSERVKKEAEPLVEETRASGKQRDREKSTQPQRLRKIADGLHEFERYADRRKRLQSISGKNKRLADLSLDHYSGFGD